MKKKIKAVFFDHDDTLVEAMKSKWAQHKYIAKTFYDKKLTNEEILRHWGKPLTALIKVLYETDNIDMAMSYNIATRPQFPKRLFNDTLSTLRTLEKTGKLIGLVTQTTGSNLKYDMDTLKIPKSLFHYVQTEDDTIFHKPDPRVFEPALDWLGKRGVSLDEILYVGDSVNDLKAATENGIFFLGIETGLISKKDFANYGVPSIEKLSDLLQFTG